jgi:tRNA(Ile)-lysidine synthetase-like protein
MIEQAIASVPAGPWAVGVSGGADSVALLSLLRRRKDLALHVVHLNHQTRGSESDADAAFVADVARQWTLPCTNAILAEIEAGQKHLESNPSARYRAARRRLLRQVVHQHQLGGVILAHHADDQAETVLHRLLRGSGWAGLAGMQSKTTLGDLVILRPMLSVPRDLLRSHLLETRQAWREDSSNASDKYLRNRLRRLLASQPQMAADLLALCAACRALRQWTISHAPLLSESFVSAELANLPDILALQSARRWLIARGLQPADADAPAAQRLLNMARDAATSPRQQFAKTLTVRRRGGRIFM